MYRVYVINKDGDPLMPTTRFKRVRILLESHQAKIKSHNPFTIQLLYEVPNKTQPLYLGIDPGGTKDKVNNRLVSYQGDHYKEGNCGLLKSGEFSIC